MASKMSFYVVKYQAKSAAYREALLSAGYVEDRRSPDVLLIDRDWFISNDAEPRAEVRICPDATVMVYPHSAMPPWWYDGLVKMQPYVKCVFVIGEGQKRAMQIIAPEARVEVIGWSWSELVPFRRPEKVKRILFAPIHPAGGKLRPEAIAANKAIMNELMGLSRDYEISVRYIGSRYRQGIHDARRIKMISGAADNSTTDIDNADLVIAEGSMMYLAVARGKPTIGINQHIPTRANKMSGRYTPKNWKLYGDDIAYPINYGSAPLKDLIECAMTEQSQWRRDFVGNAFRPRAFAAKVEKIWREAH